MLKSKVNFNIMLKSKVNFNIMLKSKVKNYVEVII
jgi:hypothetical protein